MVRIPEKGQAWLRLAALGASIFMISAVAQADTLTTVPGGTVVLGSGSVLTDSADLEGTAPFGTITFTLENPAATVVDVEIVSVGGNGTYSTPSGFSPGQTGTYDWFAEYQGFDIAPVDITVGPEPEVVVSSTPEPSSLLLLGTGLLGLVGAMRRKWLA